MENLKKKIKNNMISYNKLNEEYLFKKIQTFKQNDNTYKKQ